MANERNAGRKPRVTEEALARIKSRYEQGESLSTLAAEYGVSRQALYKRLQRKPCEVVHIDYCVDGECTAVIEADFTSQKLNVLNYALQLSRLPFGWKEAPSWDDFLTLLEREYLRQMQAEAPGVWLMSDAGPEIPLSDLEGETLRITLSRDEIPVFRFRSDELLLTRTDTDGFQLKGLSADRKFFVKSQALLAGVPMRDWAVEIIACDIAGQLSIPCISQRRCEFVYEGRRFDGVYSGNFELDGFAFVSFERLLESVGRSSKEDVFLRMGAIEKLKWCASQLSEIGGLPFEETERYMIDLAVLDALIGNVDRHTRNFGLFFETATGKYRIPPAFDNGMGLFEHDSYRDRYESYEQAMNNVYVAPYGEDPFDMLQALDETYGIRKLYPGVTQIHYPDLLTTPFALEYERRMQEQWQKFV
ncbi:MAG: helix-turn-helix domain-containing protein [Lachnospiraceae bacterium]|nr:helix-turn-helix domain-containing protein [Lachnospiraceae bacterium]